VPVDLSGHVCMCPHVGVWEHTCLDLNEVGRGAPAQRLRCALENNSMSNLTQGPMGNEDF
jgi:hypothetical protein